MSISLDPLLIWVARAAVAVLLTHAALAKLGDGATLEQHLLAYRVPVAWLSVVAWVLPFAELLTTGLLLSPLRAIGALAAVALLCLFGAAMARALLQGRVLDCGCGGEPLPVSWALVVRNGVLAAVAGLAAAPSTGRHLQGPDFLVVVLAILLSTLLYAAWNQVLRHQPATRVRTH